jgi:hypothetical protein
MSETPDSPTAGLGRAIDVRIRRQSRVAMWRRRYVNVRTIVTVVVLLSLIAPGVAAIVDAAI